MTWLCGCYETDIFVLQVLVMTPQILLDALRKAFMRMEMICLIVIDECHRATGNHPYTKIMKVSAKTFFFFHVFI